MPSAWYPQLTSMELTIYIIIVSEINVRVTKSVFEISKNKKSIQSLKSHSSLDLGSIGDQHAWYDRWTTGPVRPPKRLFLCCVPRTVSANCFGC